MAKSGDQDRIMIIRGPFTQHDERLLGGLAVRLGYSVQKPLRGLYNRFPELFADTGEGEPQAMPYKLDQITSREQFLAREHFLELWDKKLSKQINQRTATAAFAKIVKAGLDEAAGIIVATREETGFPVPFATSLQQIAHPHVREASDYTIQVDSLLGWADNYKPGDIRGFGAQMEYLTRQLTAYLKRQLKD